MRLILCLGQKRRENCPARLDFGFWILFVFVDVGLVFGLYFAFLHDSYAGEQPGACRDGSRHSTAAPGTFRGEQADIRYLFSQTTKLTSASCFLKQCQQQSFSTSQRLCFAKNMLKVRSPRGAKGRAGRGQKESTAAFGPMPNFEREVQRIIAEQEIVSKVNQRANSMSFFKDFNQVTNPRWPPTQRSLSRPPASSNSREEAPPSGKRNWSATSPS